jgi:hypothetical protein
MYNRALCRRRARLEISWTIAPAAVRFGRPAAMATNFIPLNSDRLALVVGDASGKGLAAALMIANVQSCVRTAALFTGDDLAALLKVVNHQGIRSQDTGDLVNLIFNTVDGFSEGHQTDDARLAVVRVGLLCTNRGAFALPHQAERLAIPA